MTIYLLLFVSFWALAQMKHGWVDWANQHWRLSSSSPSSSFLLLSVSVCAIVEVKIQFGIFRFALNLQCVSEAHGYFRIAQPKEMDCDVSRLHKLQENDGRRKAHWPRQSLRKSYLRRNRWLLQLSEAPFCNWGSLFCCCCVNFGFVFIFTGKFDFLFLFLWNFADRQGVPSWFHAERAREGVAEEGGWNSL